MIVLLIDIINWKPAVTLLRNIWPCSLQSLHPGLMFQPHCHCPLWPEVAQGNLYPEFVLAQAGTSHLTGHRVAEMRPKGAWALLEADGQHSLGHQPLPSLSSWGRNTSAGLLAATATAKIPGADAGSAMWFFWKPQILAFRSWMAGWKC